MSDCIFCKISEGAVPCHKIYEDDYALAFLDIFPHAKGHTVIIPKKHFASLDDIGLEEWNFLMSAVYKVAKRVEEVLKPDGMNIAMNNKPVAGQAVPHMHWHILPRYDGDGGGSVHSIIKNPGDIKPEELIKLFK